MDYEIFNTFPSYIFILNDENIIYANENCITLLNLNTKDKIQDIEHTELIEYCQTDEKPRTITMEDIVYYVRCVRFKENLKFVEIQNMNIDTCNMIINNFSKEVRSPLHGITGIIEILSATSLNNQQQEYIHMVRECSAELLHIINNIIDYTKILEGRLTPVDKVNDMNAYIKQTKNIITSKMSKHKIKVDYNIPTFDEKYLFDMNRLQQVLINLMTNAVDNTKEGGVTLNITKEQKNQEYDVIKFEVVDTGRGIDVDDIKKLFKPFCKLKQHDHHNKIGLGLLITKHIIKKMGGTIHLDTVKGRGSRFYFTLNIKKTMITTNVVFQSKMKNKHILIINNDNQERLELSSFIIKNKLDVVSVPSIMEAMVVYLSNNYMFDYIIMNPVGNEIKDIKRFKSLLTDPIYSNVVLITIGEQIHKSLVISSPIDYNILKKLLYENTGPERNTSTHILIIEDQRSNQLVLETYLKNMNYKNIDIANNGSEGVLKVIENQKRYDLILTDIMMPVMNGIDATRKIMKIDNKNVIVGISADITATAETCIDAGMKELIVKPVNYKVFKTMCEQYL